MLLVVVAFKTLGMLKAEVVMDQLLDSVVVLGKIVNPELISADDVITVSEKKPSELQVELPEDDADPLEEDKTLLVGMAEWDPIPLEEFVEALVDKPGVKDAELVKDEARPVREDKVV